MTAGTLALRYDLRAPSFGASISDLYAAMLDQVEWAEEHLAIDLVMLSEHHSSPDGYCPSPLVAAAAIAARTKRVRIQIAAVVLPLHDPIRIAEDAAVADIISGGRIELVAVAGYRPAEFELFGKDHATRGPTLEHHVGVLRKAWSGQPIGERQLTVTPLPSRPGGPPILLGGSSREAARRAARVGDGFIPGGGRADLADVYLAERSRLGLPAGFVGGGGAPLGVHVTEDVDEGWAAMGPHLAHDWAMYGQWSAEAKGSSAEIVYPSVDEMRTSGRYAVVTPAECVALWNSLGDSAMFSLHPLVGGAAPELGWRSLELFGQQVLPQIDRA